MDAAAAKLGMPTEGTVEADIERVLGAEVLHKMRSRPSWSVEKWTKLCLGSFLGFSLQRSCKYAHIIRETSYLWFDAIDGLRDLYESYSVDAEVQLAAGVHVHSHASQDPRHLQWLAERRCEQFRPPSKQVEIKTSGPLGMNVVLTRGDGVVIPPPAPDTEDGSDDSDAV